MGEDLFSFKGNIWEFLPKKMKKLYINLSEKSLMKGYFDEN